VNARNLGTVADRLAVLRPRRLESDVRIRAAVSLVLCEGAEDLRLLMIRRAETEGDRWSGHIGFPGGRMEPSDADERATAERECREELGLDLRAARPLGRLDDLGGTVESVRVSAFVYGVTTEPRLRPNHEVQQAFWRDLADFEDPVHQLERRFPYGDEMLELPALRVSEGEGPLLWGLSYRFLELLMGSIGRPIPPMQWREDL
jgi:8-oxo-dGTP pyrophosphatase MutT (NUDIX family)